MKKNPLLIIFLLVFILSACAKPTPTPVVQTQAPTQEPVEATSVTVDPTQVIEPAAVPLPTEGLAQRRANPWQWVSFTGPTETLDIEAPDR